VHVLQVTWAQGFITVYKVSAESTERKDLRSEKDGEKRTEHERAV
jgi:hypothetical protein